MSDRKWYIRVSVVIALTVVALAVGIDALVRAAMVQDDRCSFMYVPEPGDWRIETDGVYYRYSVLDTGRVWRPSQPYDQAWMAMAAAKIADKRRRWEPL